MKKGIILVVVLVLAFLEYCIVDVQAVPNFARKYKTSCITCHAPFPRLTAFGEAFRLNGFKIPEGDESYVKEKPLKLGAEAYKRVFPNSVWPSDLPGLPVISFRVVSDLEYDISDVANDRDSSYKIEFPHEMEILYAGTFGDTLSFFGEIELEHHEEDLELGYEAWLLWQDIVSEKVFNLKVGNIGAHEIGLPSSLDSERITKNHYLYRDELQVKGYGPGIEFNGFGRNWKYAVGILKAQNEYSEEDFFAQLAFKIGGIGFDGSAGSSEEGGLSTTPAGYWVDDSIRVGGFFLSSQDTDFDRYGFDVRGNYKDLSLGIGFVSGEKDDEGNIDTWFIEAEYFAFPWMQPYIRYENLTSDIEDSDLARILVGANMIARANVLLKVEGRIYSTNDPVESEGNNKNLDDRIYLRLSFAF